MRHGEIEFLASIASSIMLVVDVILLARSQTVPLRVIAAPPSRAAVAPVACSGTDSYARILL